MNRTRVAHRTSILLSIAVLVSAAILALTGHLYPSLAAMALGACGIITVLHLQHRASLASQRSILRTLKTLPAASPAVVPHHVEPSTQILRRAVTPLIQQMTSAEDARIRESAALRVSVRSLYRDVQQLSAAVERLQASSDERHRWHVGQSNEIRKRFELIPSEVSDLEALRRHLAVPQITLPSLGGWALSAPSMTAVASEILQTDRPTTVLELGSGSSTAFLAMTIKSGQGGHVYALEHDSSFADATRTTLEQLDLEDYATVVLAPLDESHPSGPFYSADAVPPVDVDVLLVDGPPAGEHPEARYSALPSFAHLLRDGATICLDDTHRQGEQAVMARWQSEYPQLKVSRRLEKSVLFTWHTGEPRKVR